MFSKYRYETKGCKETLIEVVHVIIEVKSTLCKVQVTSKLFIEVIGDVISEV